MSETTPSQKLPANHHAAKPKTEPESHLLPSATAQVESSSLVQDELLDESASSFLRPVGSTILQPPTSGVLSGEPSTLLQQTRSAGSKSQAKPQAAPGFAGRNFAGLPTRGTIQAKLTVGAAHDPYEEEADQVAEQVMRMPAATFAASGEEGDADEDGHSLQRSFEDEEELQAKPLASVIASRVQRAPETIDEDTVKQVIAEDKTQPDSQVQRIAKEEEDEIQPQHVSAADSFETDSGFEGRVAATHGGGSPLPGTIRSFMEPRFGADFSGVRVHADREAADLNRQVSAQAFTLGNDIYLSEGKTDLTSASGKQLLAHELTHVVQQGGAVARKPIIRREADTEEPPLSLDAAVSEAETEVTEAEVQQETVELDSVPVELPTDNKVEGVAEQSTGGGGTATAAPTPAAANAEPISKENTLPIAAQNTSATAIAGVLEETATPPPIVDTSTLSASASATASAPTALSGLPVDTGATPVPTTAAPLVAAAMVAPVAVEEVNPQASASSAAATSAGAPTQETASSMASGAELADAAAPTTDTGPTSDTSAAATNTVADQPSPAAPGVDTPGAKPAQEGAASPAPAGNALAATAGVPTKQEAQPTTPGAVPTPAPSGSTDATTVTGSVEKVADASTPAVEPGATPTTTPTVTTDVPTSPAAQPTTPSAGPTPTPAPSGGAAAAKPGATPTTPTGPLEKTTPTTTPAAAKTPAAVNLVEGTAALAPVAAQPSEATAPSQPTEASATTTPVRPEEEKKPVRRMLWRRILQRALAIAPRSAEEDPAFQQVVAHSKAAAQQEKTHEPAGTAVAESQAAADPKGKDVEMQAQQRQVAEMRTQPTGAFNAEAFKQKLFEKIKEAAPQNLKEADEFKKNNKVGAIKDSLAGEVKQQKQQAEGSLEKETEQAPDKSGIPGKPVEGLEKPESGPQPLDLNAKGAAPKPKTEAEVSVPLQEQSKALDQQMAQGGVTEEQLEKSNEPAFQQALQEKKAAQQNAQNAPAAYRKDEQAMLGQAQNQAQTTADAKSKETRSEKEQLLAQVFGLQGQTKGADESQRQAVEAHVADVYLQTKQDVEQILNGLDSQVNERFEKGATVAKQAFEDQVDSRMSKYKQERYLSRLDGPILWVRDQFAGLPEEVNTFYVEGRNLYLAKMDACLIDIANYVAAELTRAKQRIAQGEQAIGKYVDGLSPELQQVGRDATQKIQGKFDDLVGSVDNKQEELIDSLKQSYDEKLQEVNGRIEEMKQANSGLINQAVQTIGGVIKTIQELGQLLMNALQRAASAVTLILQDPIKFLGNLIKGVAQGIQRFGANILTHLQTGLITWLTGALGGVITSFPKSFTDLRGILSMVLEILGLTYAQIRSKVVQGVGEKGEQVVGALEKAWEIFQIIRTQGLGGLWEFIKDMIGDLKAMVIDQIQSILVNEVIQAGIQWIVGLLGGPAGAFVKAVQAIIRIVTWFINNAGRLLAFVNSVLDSIVSIAQGDVSAAARYIENTLAKALPLVIGFLADLLGLGGIAKKVQGIIVKIRAPIDKAIAWIVKKAVALAKKILSKLKFGKKGKEDQANTPEVQKRWDEGMVALGQLKDKSKQDPLSKKEIDTELTGIKSKYQFKELKAKQEGQDWEVYADMNPKKTLTGFEGEADADAENVKKAVTAAGGIVNFMKAMATGQTIEGINRASLEKVWGENQKIKDWLKDKFRDATPGNHEWIPSNMMMDVINRATNIVWGIEAANWIDLQHELRTDTSWVIFSPDYSSKRLKGKVVLQGHPGAIYVREKNADGEEYLQPQTAGVNKWHDALRDKFTNNTKAATVLGSLRTFFGYTVWDGKNLPGNLYPEHRDSNGNLLDMNALRSNQQANFDRTQTMFATLMEKYS